MNEKKRREKKKRGEGRVGVSFYVLRGKECDQRGVSDRNAVVCRVRGKCDRTTTPETSKRMIFIFRLGYTAGLAGWLAKDGYTEKHSVEEYVCRTGGE